MTALLALLFLAAPKPVTLTRTAGVWSLSAPRSCKQIQGKTITIVPNGADWGELKAALFPLFACGPERLQLGAVTLALPSATPKPVIILKNESLWLWHEGARTRIDAVDLESLKTLTGGGVALYLAPTVMLSQATLDRVKHLGPIELSDTTRAGVRVTAGESARAEAEERPSGALTRLFGSAEMPVAGAAPPPSWISGGPKRCVNTAGAPVVWAAGVAAGVFDPTTARATADAAARVEMAKYLEANPAPTKGKSKITTPPETRIIDHFDDAASKTFYALAETTTVKGRGEELDTCADADVGVTWTWQAVDADGGPKRVPPDWTKAVTAGGLSGEPKGLHFSYNGAPKTAFSASRSAAEAAFVAALLASLQKVCPASVVDANAISGAEWFSEQQLGKWTFRAILAWARLPDTAFGGCTRESGEVSLGRPPPMQNGPGWVSRGTSETSDAMFIATKNGDTSAIWNAVLAKLATALPASWPSRAGTEFLIKMLAQDATGTQTWRDNNYAADYALRRIPKLAIVQRLRECQQARLCDALTDEKRVIEQLQPGLSKTVDAQAASKPAN